MATLKDMQVRIEALERAPNAQANEINGLRSLVLALVELVGRFDVLQEVQRQADAQLEQALESVVRAGVYALSHAPAGPEDIVVVQQVRAQDGFVSRAHVVPKMADNAFLGALAGDVTEVDGVANTVLGAYALVAQGPAVPEQGVDNAPQPVATSP